MHVLTLQFDTRFDLNYIVDTFRGVLLYVEKDE